MWFYVVFSGMALAGQVAIARTDTSEAEVRIQVATEPVQFDPVLVEDGIGFRFMSLTMRGLYRYDRHSIIQMDVPHQWVEQWPAAAIRIILGHGPDKRASNDSRKVFWSDGTPLLAKHFQWSFDRALAADSVAPLSSFFRPASLGTKFEFRAIDENTILIQLDKTQFKDKSEFHGFCLYLKHLMTLPMALPSRWEKPQSNYVSNGLYHLVERSEKDGLLFEVNDAALPKYGPHPKVPRSIRWLVVKDENAALNLLRTKKLDILTRLPQTWKPESTIHLKQWPYDANVYMGMNVKSAALQSLPIRTTIAKALSSEDFSIFSKHEAERSRSWSDSSMGSDTNLVQSNEKGDEEGMQGRDSKYQHINLTYCTDGGSRNRTIAERIQYVLLKKIGIQVTIKERDWRSHVAALKAGQCDLFRYGWLDPMPIAFARFVPFTGDSQHNHTGWRNEEYDQLVSRLKLIYQRTRTNKGSDLNEKNIVKRLNQLLTKDEAVIVPLFRYKQAYLMSDAILKKYPLLMYNRQGSLYFD